jgi:hypothetical protein
MTDERRYGDDEVAEIFQAAATDTSPRRATVASVDGLTLAELQAIGSEAGMSPARVAEAALGLDARRAVLPVRTDLGMPISVGRVVDLPRALDDREWAVLVGELRATFRARGHDRSEGELRQWNNGNLQACLEPTDSGYRLRLDTVKGDAVMANRIGIGGLIIALFILLAMTLTGNLPEDLMGPAILAALSSTALASNAVRLPRWARERDAQMAHIEDRVRALVAAPRDDG